MLRVQLQTARPWIARGTWALIDQILFAGANFLLNVLLARLLPPVEFGAFSVALAVFFLVATLHSSVLSDPMLALGSSDFEKDFGRYLRKILRWHGVVMAAVTGIFLVVALGFELAGSVPMATAFAGLSFSTPFVLLAWLMRRACHASLEPRMAAVGSATYLAILIPGALFLNLRGWLSLWNAYVLLGAASIGAAAVIGFGLPRLWRWLAVAIPDGEFAEKHWHFARWALGNNVMMWAVGNVPGLLLPLWADLQTLAALRALQMLFLPVYHVVPTICWTVVLPVLARSQGTSRARRILHVGMALTLVMPVAYGVAVVALSRPIMEGLYAGRYAADARWLWLLIAASAVSSVLELLTVSLRAAKLVDKSFWAYAAGAAAVALLTTSLLPVSSFLAVIGGPMAANVLTSVLLARMLYPTLVSTRCAKVRCRPSVAGTGASRRADRERQETG